MLKRGVTYSLAGVLVLVVVLTVAATVVRKRGEGRIAPGVTVCGRDLSGVTWEEAEAVIGALAPECVTELRCRLLPEMREEVEARVGEINADNYVLAVEEKEVVLVMKMPLLRVDEEDTLQSVFEKSSEVKLWEWLYGALTRRPFRIREAKVSLFWEEALFGESVARLKEVTERDRQDAEVRWEQGKVTVTESARGFRLDTETLWKDAEGAMQEAIEQIEKGVTEELILRFYVSGTALMPSLSTAQAKKCNTVIGTFSTVYAGAGEGRAQNIEAGAKKLHGTVVLPGGTFSVAEALMPFTEENGYAVGGTYINGQLSESIGGGVCQLSTTLYNALLQTKLEIVERHPHSMPVGYVPLGRDAAIAGDYKDLKFKNTTNVPVLLLCETAGTKVKVTVYGTQEVKRGAVVFESVVTEENEEKVTVEVYRIEKRANGEVSREKVSGDGYKRKTVRFP